MTFRRTPAFVTLILLVASASASASMIPPKYAEEVRAQLALGKVGDSIDLLGDGDSSDIYGGVPEGLENPFEHDEQQLHDMFPNRGYGPGTGGDIDLYEVESDIEKYLDSLRRGDVPRGRFDKMIAGNDGTKPGVGDDNPDAGGPIPDAMVGGEGATQSLDGAPDGLLAITGAGSVSSNNSVALSGDGVGDGATVSSLSRGEIAWNGYVRIRRPQDGLFEVCSGILVSPMHVLTAAHCATDIVIGEGETSTVDVGARTQKAVAYEIVGCELAPGAFDIASFEDRVEEEYDETPKLECGFANRYADVDWEGFDPYPQIDLALLRISGPVPKTLAKPRPVLISTLESNWIWKHDVQMFGYGYVWSETAVGEGEHRCSKVDDDEGLTLTDTRQRMRGEWFDTNIDQRLRLRARPEEPVPGSSVIGAVCGDSGGGVTMPAGAAWQRELVVGVISEGNSADGITVVSPTFTPQAESFLMASELATMVRADLLGSVPVKILCHKTSGEQCRFQTASKP